MNTKKVKKKSILKTKNPINNKTRLKKQCMKTFAENKIKYWTSSYTDQIKKLENKKTTKEEQKLLIKLKKQKKSQVKTLKKQYQLNNCNINCKNTLLEPGPANHLPKTMRKEFHYSPKLIKIFTKRRKEIFKNKKNVLVDNFYEKIPIKIKQKLLKEGAISECMPIIDTLNGGSFIFKDGKKKETTETFQGKPFFRKVFYYSDPPEENQIIASENEFAIASILINNPFPNIVTFYEIKKDYIEMEELDINNKLNKLSEVENQKLINTMRKVKDFLQSLGIMYIDWKHDNIGISKDGTYKLFDFDVSGVIDVKTNQWTIKPLEYWSYNNAIKNGFYNPKQIDDFAFEYGLVGIKDKPI